MELLYTLAFTLLILIGLFSLFFRLKRTSYRLDKTNLICLFEMILSGEASEADWNVFLEMPIRHDDYLEKLRARCIELEGEEIFPKELGVRLSERGRVEIGLILEELKKAS